MDIQKYQVFAETAKTKNITKTAEIMGYTQSGISHILKSLEQELDLPLFTRDRYGVRLTAVGEDILPYIHRILQECAQLEQIVSDIHGIERGTLSIGTFSSISIHWLPPILGAFQKQHPHITIRLHEGGIHDIERWISNANIDLGFYSCQPKHHFQFIHLKYDPLVAVLPKDYPLEEQASSFPLEGFKDQPFILSEIGVDYDINRVLRHQDIRPDVRFTAKDDYAIISMVSHHLGISILPKLITEGHFPGIKTLPLSPATSRDLGIGLLDVAAASPAAKKFIWFVEEYFGVPHKT